MNVTVVVEDPESGALVDVFDAAFWELPQSGHRLIVQDGSGGQDVMVVMGVEHEITRPLDTAYPGGAHSVTVRVMPTGEDD